MPRASILDFDRYQRAAEGCPGLSLTSLTMGGSTKGVGWPDGLWEQILDAEAAIEAINARARVQVEFKLIATHAF